MQNELKKQWLALWEILGAQGDPHTVFDDLVKRYSEPPRAYHTLRHVQNCLDEFQPAMDLAHDLEAVEIALWYHDATSDEERSATLAMEMLRDASLPRSFGEQVATLVRATKHGTLPIDPDARLVADIDLSILGQPEDIFDEYERQIRQEYEHVPLRTFARKRREILLRFLKRPRIYLTRYFYDRYEFQARRNLTRSVEKLSRST